MPSIIYHEYGNPFPVTKISGKGVGAAPVIFRAQQGSDIVQDNAYLRELARNAKQADARFLRFASEMNGNWVAWNGNPAKYIENSAWFQVMKEKLLMCPF